MTPRRRRILLAVLALIALDQLLLWTFVTRPVNSLRDLIELTGRAEPPYFQLRPGLDTTYSSWRRGDVSHVHTSPEGFRDPARDEPKKVGGRRVVVTGDSITFGIGVNDDEAFPRQMEALLREQGLSDIEVRNMGVPGYAMADHLGLLRAKILPLRPDVVVLQLSRNDSAVPMPLSPTFMEALRFSGFARAWMIVRFNFVRDVALFDRSFDAYVDECASAGVRLVVAREGVPEESEERVARLARDKGFPLVEIGGDAYPKLPDDPHYSAEGNRRVAARLVPEVRTALGGGP